MYGWYITSSGSKRAVEELTQRMHASAELSSPRAQETVCKLLEYGSVINARIMFWVVDQHKTAYLANLARHCV